LDHGMTRAQQMHLESRPTTGSDMFPRRPSSRSLREEARIFRSSGHWDGCRRRLSHGHGHGEPRAAAISESGSGPARSRRQPPWLPPCAEDPSPRGAGWERAPVRVERRRWRCTRTHARTRAHARTHARSVGRRRWRSILIIPAQASEPRPTHTLHPLWP
jgi:hypothetical protein